MHHSNTDCNVRIRTMGNVDGSEQMSFATGSNIKPRLVFYKL